MQRSDNRLWFRYPVFDPSGAVLNVVDDWARNFMQGTTDLDLVLGQPYRVAALPVFYNEESSWTYLPEIKDLDLEQFDLVLFSDPEYYDLDRLRAWLPTQNALLATGGIQTGTCIDPDREVYRAYYIRDFLEQNHYQDTQQPRKPYRFEALLGARRPHRDFVWKAFRRSGLLADSIVTYRSGFPGEIQSYLTDEVSDKFGEFLQWPYVSPNLRPEWEVSAEITNRDSRQSPVEIYRRTWYSVICETQFTGTNFFLSEKTIKAMFNRRMFVMFGPCQYLANLRRHGFQTFCHCIDENYDDEYRDIMRYEKALHQIWRLAWLEDPVKIYQNVEAVLDHNKQHLQELEHRRCKDMQSLLTRHIPGEHWHWPPLQIA